LKIKLKDRHLDWIEVIGAESQAVLNTLTELGFQDAFKKWQKLLRGCMWSASPKSVFDRMAAAVP
jgi:hypothetical protein